MLNVQSGKNTLETNLYDGVRLVSVLLRIGHYDEAASLAGQLLVHFPQALPLHVGIGRALLATAEEGPHITRALGHLRRVLDSDPENWRIRIEIVLLCLRGSSALHERAGHELWLAAQSAPDNRWLRDMIERLPPIGVFRRTQEWNRFIMRGLDAAAPPPSAQLSQDEGGVARLYLRREMPWMAVQYFERAIGRLKPGEARADLKTGLLTALWLNGETKKASALASDMLLDQPQLLLPRLLLTSHLSQAALRNTPEALVRLIEPVWHIDPFLDRAGELAQLVRLEMPAALWPRPAPQSPFEFDHNRPAPHFLRPVRLLMGNLDRDWLLTLLEASRRQDAEMLAGGGSTRAVQPHAEVSYTVSDLDGMLMSLSVARLHPDILLDEDDDRAAVIQKGSEAIRPAASDAGLDEIASSIAEVERLLYGGKTPKASKGGKRPKNGGGRMSVTSKGGLLSKFRAPGGNPPPPRGAEAAARSAAAAYNANLSFKPEPAPAGVFSLRQASALLVSSERALTAKYGPDGFRQILVLLEQWVEARREHGFEARLLLVDSPAALRRHGFGGLNPVQAGRPEAVRELINAALPGEVDGPPAAYPNSVFIIGGPDIIPYWSLPNPSFDTDRQILTDNPYGARDNTYLLPERLVGRLPDDCGPRGESNLRFFLLRLHEAVNRQQSLRLPHSPLSAWPLKFMENLMPAAAKAGLDELGGLNFERDWLRKLSGHQQFLDKHRAAQLAPFFYSAEAWKTSTTTLRNIISGATQLVMSPPTRANSLETRLLQEARLLHFNLHGFKDTSNWYGQSHANRLIASPSLSSLPVAFNPELAGLVRGPGSVVFSEACYGVYLPGKSVHQSIALTLLAQGAAAVVGSTAISYGSSGPELACAGHLAYYFWREVLVHGSAFGRALQAAKINYARERLAAGHNLTGDDAKTLLEFMLLGDPTIGLGGVSPTTVSPAELASTLAGSNPEIVQKGGFTMPRINLERELDEFNKLRGKALRVWGRFTQKEPPADHYQKVDYEELPPEVKLRVKTILKWLLPDPLEADPQVMRAALELGAGYNATGTFERPFALPSAWVNQTRHQKGGSGPHEAQLLLTGQRPVKTADGRTYEQAFHLATDMSGGQIDVNLSRGKG